MHGISAEQAAADFASHRAHVDEGAVMCRLKVSVHGIHHGKGAVEVEAFRF